MKSIQDPYGYDRHELMRSYLIPTVAAVVFLGFAASAFLSLLPATQGADDRVIAAGLDKFVSLLSKDLVDASFSQSHIAASLAFVSCIVIALVIARYVHEDNEQYMEAYPYIDEVYSQEQRQEIRKTGRAFMLASLPFFAAWVILLLLEMLDSPLLRGVGYLLLAVGVWFVLHGLLLSRRANEFLYNYRSLDHISIYELEADKELPDRDLRLTEKRMRRPMRTAKRVVITAGFLAALCLYALPSIETPFYWVAVVVAFIISGIIGKYSEVKIEKLV